MPKLDGLRIVITRAAHQFEELAIPLKDLGAEVIALPLIGIAPPADPQPLQEAVKRAGEYDWIVFTSANAVHAYAAQGSRPTRPRIAAIGPATREAAQQAGFHVSLVPEKYIAESLVDAFGAQNLSQRRILIPGAAVTRDVVPAALRQCGARVDVVVAYENVIPPEAPALAAAVFRQPYPDWVTFASSSAVDHLVQLIGTEHLGYSKIATIGPATSNSVRKYRLTVDAEADPHTIAGLVEALAKNY